MSDLISAQDVRQMTEHAEAFERLAMNRPGWASTNRSLLLEAGLPLNELVLGGLAPPAVRCYVRLKAAAESFSCDILGSDTLKHERVENIGALMAAHLVERTPVGYRLHRLTLSYPSPADLAADKDA